MDLIGTFGFKSSKDIDKFSEFDHDICESGLPRLTHDTLATFEVSVDSTIDVGTHLVFIGTVKSAEVVGEGTPITYDYYHRVLRGKTPAKAASYNDGDDPAKDEIVEVEETASSEQKVAWRCKMCGYTVEGYPDGPSRRLQLPPVQAWDATTSRRCSSSRSFQTRMRALAASAHAITI